MQALHNNYQNINKPFNKEGDNEANNVSPLIILFV